MPLPAQQPAAAWGSGHQWAAADGRHRVDPSVRPQRCRTTRPALTASRGDRARGVVRSLTSEEFASLVEGAEPRTADDHPWTFPAKVRMRRTRRGAREHGAEPAGRTSCNGVRPKGRQCSATGVGEPTGRVNRVHSAPTAEKVDGSTDRTVSFSLTDPCRCTAHGVEPRDSGLPQERPESTFCQVRREPRSNRVQAPPPASSVRRGFVSLTDTDPRWNRRWPGPGCARAWAPHVRLGGACRR
jgi:hypothetical protein